MGYIPDDKWDALRLGILSRRTIRGRGELHSPLHSASPNSSMLPEFTHVQDKGFKSMGIDNDQLRQQAERNATNAAISHVVSQHTSNVAPAPSAPANMPEQPTHHAEDESVRLVLSSAGSAHDI